MGVIVGAIGKNPSIEKYNSILKNNSQQTMNEYMEKMIIGGQQEMRMHYPEINIDLSFLEAGKGEK